MSLILHLPLIDNTLDYSGNNNHGVSYNADSVPFGRFGSSYLFGDNKSVRTGVISHYGDITLSAWVYPTDLTTIVDSATIRGIISNHNHLIFSNFTMFFSNSKLSVHMGFTDNTRSYGITSNLTFQINNWYHVLFTYEYKTNLCKIYVNGELDNELILIKTVKFTPYNFVVGNWAHSYLNAYEFIGNINDVRVYDSALSEKEIKLLYNSNILNYSFNDPIQPIDNLARNKTYTIYNNFGNTRVPSTLVKLNEKYQGCDIYRLSMTLVDSTVLSSFRNDLGSHGVYGFSRTFLANTKYSFSILFRPVTHTDIVVGGTASNIGGWTSFGQRYYKDDWMITGQYRDGSVSTGKTDNIFTSFRSPSVLSGDTVSIDFCCPRLIEGIDYLVDYIDYDKEFDNIIRDSSGFNNNSQPLSFNNSPRWTSSGKTGNGCYLFDGVDDFIKISSSKYLRNKEFSASMWINLKSTGTTQSLFSSRVSFNDGTMFYINASGSIVFDWNDGVQYRWTTGYNVPLNEWVHLVVSVNSSGRFLYVNGVLFSSTSSVGGNPVTPYEFTIGNDTIYSYPFNGFIDDFKIFSTSLNLNEVISLYKIKASIDNVGGFYSSEFNEKPNMFDQVNNQIKLKTFGNGLYFYVQSNCQISLTDDGYRIYSPPNFKYFRYLYAGNASSGQLTNIFYGGNANSQVIDNTFNLNCGNSNNTYQGLPLNIFDDTPNLIYPDDGNPMWGGLRLRPFELDNFYLFKNRKYKVSFKVKGKSSNDPGKIYFTNQMGWSGGAYGLGSVSAYDFNTLGTNFEGEKEIYACFNITDEVFKYCTTSYSNFVTGETYNCYLDLSWEFNYTSTGELGTDLYLSDFKFIDITDDLDKTSVSEKGVVNTIEYSEVGPCDDLIAWIPLDSNPNDISLNAVKGTVFGSPEISSGVLSNSYLFDGVDDYINTNLKCNNILNDNENFSLTAWVYILSNPTVGAQIISCSAYNSEVEGGGFGIGINTDGVLVFKLGDLDTTSEIPFNSTIFNKDVWHFVTLTFDGNNLNCYKNGSLLSKTPRTIWNSNNYNILIGKGTQGGWGGYFNGKISDVRIYSKSLSLEEINILYEISGGNNMVKTKILSDKIYVKNEIKEI